MADDRKGWRSLFSRTLQAVGLGPTELVLLKDSFEDQIDFHIADIEMRRRAASRSVRGAAKRMEAVLSEAAALDEFRLDVLRRTNQRSLNRLPKVIGLDGLPVAQVHKLIVGPWQACFLLHKDNSTAIALTFTRGQPDWEALTKLIELNSGGNR